MRLAWYATPDASGAQIAIDDSPVASMGAPEVVTTGPVQAPPGALSARVRILLRPAATGASMAVSDVMFSPTSPPPPTPTPTPTPTATATPTATPTPTTTPLSAATPAPTPPSAPPSGPAGPVTSAPSAGGPATPAAAAADRDALAAAQRWLRITELLPNAEQPGIDADYEWVEITNLGPDPVSTAGMALRDNAATTSLDSMTLAPRSSLIVAAPFAEVGAAPLVQRVTVIGNGLSNTGDRLALLAIDGSIVDALSYGNDTAYVDPAHPISAPRAGQSIERRFAADGTLAEVAYLDVPTPGVAAIVSLAEPPAPAPPHEAQVAAPLTGSSEQERVPASPATPQHTAMWVILVLLAGGILGGAAAHRVSVILRAQREQRVGD